MKFAVGVAAGDALVGVAVIGRPVARHLDDGMTVEVTRTCTDGTANSNSMLYGAAWRVARGLGYSRLVTYTQCGESGSSLRAAGFIKVAQLRPRSWPDRLVCGTAGTGTRRDQLALSSVDRGEWAVPVTDQKPFAGDSSAGKEVQGLLEIRTVHGTEADRLEREQAEPLQEVIAWLSTR
ncbi:hypothetical protein GCM10023148_05580 [Actinokineospora soli]